MASLRHQKRRACEGKRPHDTQEEAVGEAGRLRKRNPGAEIDAYRCKRCGKFHVGHRKLKTRRILAARRGEI
jgi:hypothetical protein